MSNIFWFQLIKIFTSTEIDKIGKITERNEKKNAKIEIKEYKQ